MITIFFIYIYHYTIPFCFYFRDGWFCRETKFEQLVESLKSSHPHDFNGNQGSHYAWGPDRVLSNPGRYSLCWCAAVTSCDAYEDFQSYAAVLQASTHSIKLKVQTAGAMPHLFSWTTKACVRLAGSRFTLTC